MKRVIQIVLLIAAAGLAYVLYQQIMIPVKFNETQALREQAVIQRLKDIREAQRAYKSVYGKYTPSMDTLINFVKNDSMSYEIKMRSEDDSAAVAEGRVKTIKVKYAVIDTIFNKNFKADDLRYIPFSNGQEFIMAADTLVTASKVTIPVFEAKAPYKRYLSDLNHQELVNLIDRTKSLNKYAGLKVGSITEATNDAGNWE